MTEIIVKKQSISKPDSYSQIKKILGYDLAFLQFQEFSAGGHTATYTTDAELYILNGSAALSLDGRETPVCAGDLVTVPGNRNIRWQVDKTIKLRYKSLEAQRIQDIYNSLKENILMSNEVLDTGSFHPCPDVKIPFRSKEALLFVKDNPGLLTSALFAVPKKILSLACINTEYLNRYSLFALWPDENRYTALDDVMALKKTHDSFPLQYKEELIIRKDSRYFRWQPDKNGRPLLDELIALRGLENIYDGLIPATKLQETIIEIVLSSLWGSDTPQFMFDYMAHPQECPYEMPYLYLPGISDLSEAVKKRWYIRGICPHEESVIEPDLSVRIQGLNSIAHDACTCIVDWLAPAFSSNGEYATWEYTFGLNGENVTLLKRELLKQYD